MKVRILAVGDVVGTPGVRLLSDHLPSLREAWDLDFVLINADNASSGRGVLPVDADRLLAAGCDVLTTGDHVWDRRELRQMLDKDPRVIRAANLSARAAGRGWPIMTRDQDIEVAVIHVLGRVFLPIPADCPFRSVDELLPKMRARTRLVVVDVHAEATSEKIALSRHLDGRVSVVVGTHTHVATADCQILPGGTGYITDLGMTGPHDSVIGRAVEPVLRSMLTGMKNPYDVATGDVRLSGALFEVDVRTGHTVHAQRIEWHENAPLALCELPTS